MRYQDDINTEHNMKSTGRAAVAQWTKHLTRNGQTPVRIREAHIFDITELYVCITYRKYNQMLRKIYVAHYPQVLPQGRSYHWGRGGAAPPPPTKDLGYSTA